MEILANSISGDNSKLPIGVKADWKINSVHCFGNYIDSTRIVKRYYWMLIIVACSFLNSGTVIVNSSPTIRSLHLKTGVNFTVKPGFVFTVNH